MTMDVRDVVSFKQGQVIFHEGDPPGALYIIEAGIVEISRGQGEDRMVVTERRSGDVFGEMALVDNQPRSATATALTDVHAYTVSEEVFSAYINELNPIIYRVFKSLVGTIREMNETQTLLAHILNLRGRLS